MSKVYHEYWGELDSKQLKVYKENNVSRSDHDSLEEMFGDDHEAIIACVLANSPNKCFQIFGVSV